VTDAEYQLLTRIEQGGGTFRPTEPGAEGRAAFAEIVTQLIALRGQGWIRLPDTRIMRDGQGRPMMAGPCDLTEAGRRALEQDRSLGPRG
jgi:hypothetical protein